MCTVSIKVNENIIRDLMPGLDSTTAIRRWAQKLIDQHIEALTREYAQQQADTAVDARFSRDMTPEELYNLIEQDVRAIYADESI